MRAMASEEETAAMREVFLAEAMHAPVPKVMHDSCAHMDAMLRRLTRKNGMAFYGQYWLLVELLTGSADHAYDVSDEEGWQMLAYDMSLMSPMCVETCKAFVAELYDAKLISREHYDELKQVAILRVLRDVRTYAEGTAKKKLGAWKTNNK